MLSGTVLANIHSPCTFSYQDWLIGDTTLRSYNASSYAQQAITFLCLDFNGVSTKYNMLPPVSCPSGIRAQIVRAFYDFLPYSANVSVELPYVLGWRGRISFSEVLFKD